MKQLTLVTIIFLPLSFLTVSNLDFYLRLVCLIFYRAILAKISPNSQAPTIIATGMASHLIVDSILLLITHRFFWVVACPVEFVVFLYLM